MSALAIAAAHLAANALWALVGKLVTQAFMDSLMSKLVLAGLEKLAASTANSLDDSIVADVRKALTGEETSQ